MSWVEWCGATADGYSTRPGEARLVGVRGGRLCDGLAGDVHPDVLHPSVSSQLQ